jgi:hypothetical protein
MAAVVTPQKKNQSSHFAVALLSHLKSMLSANVMICGLINFIAVIHRKSKILPFGNNIKT